MRGILTDEEKKYLKRTCRYLNSIGLTEGLIEFDLSDGSIDPEDIEWRYITHFSNNYHAEIPNGLIPIIKKILSFINKNNLIDFVDIDNMNWERVEINIDCESSEISVKYDYGYYEPGETQATSWDLVDDANDEDLKEIFDVLRKEYHTRLTILELEYNGSGDSGYIESSFTNGEQVPQILENWCYDRLESMHGGWEINEGSQGKFEIDLSNGVIELYHQYNEDVNNFDTVYEENF